MSTGFEAMQPMNSIFPSDLFGLEDKSRSESSGMFQDIFDGVINQVKESEEERSQIEYLFATGQLDNPAELTIAGTKSQMSVELLVQLRNKALDAYSELMRISL